jgi:hypothetical protein
MVATLLLQEAIEWDIRSLVGYPIYMTIVCLFVLFWLAIVLLPFGKLLKRTGHQVGWCFLFIIPFVNLIALWIFAFKRWPTDKRNP